MSGLMDYGAIMRSGAALVPDYQQQQMQRQEMALRKQEADVRRTALEQRVSEAKQQLERKTQFQTAVTEYLANPSPGGAGRLMMQFPEFAEPINKGFSAMDDATRASDLRSLGSIYARSQAGDYKGAAATIRARIDADIAATGQADPEDEAMLAAMESGDPVQQKAASGMVGFAIASIVGPDKFGSTYGNITETGGDFTLVPGARRFDSTGKLIAEAPFAPRPVTVGEGQTVVEYQPGSGGAQGGEGTPRGVRNNNPGNLRDGPFARNQPGYKGVDNAGFAIFASAEQGTAAKVKLLENRYLKRGLDTPDKLVETYAPASENSAESRANYKAHIARRLGIGINDKIPPSALPVLAQAIGEFENGTWQGGSGQPRVIAKGAPKTKEPPKPSETRVVNGQVFVKVNGSWYRKAQ